MKGKPENCRAMDKARAAWGEPLPAWIAALARAADGKSVRGTAAVLGVSPALVSLALRNRYPRPLDMLRAKVEAVMSYEIIPCPIMGMITRADCLHWQNLPYVGSNALRVAVYRACRAGCIQYEGRS